MPSESSSLKAQMPMPWSIVPLMTTAMFVKICQSFKHMETYCSVLSRRYPRQKESDKVRSPVIVVVPCRHPGVIS